MMKSKRKRFRIGSVLVGMAFLGLLYVLRFGLPETEEADVFPPEAYTDAASDGTEENTSESTETSAEVVVHVDGAVRNPGVYRLDAAARVNDAVEKAGGLTREAELADINLALPLSDGMKIRIPVKGEQIRQSTSVSPAETGAVNINTASKEELTALPGIGESKAEAIIRYREENGAFGCIEDLKKVNGIGDGVFEKVRELITV